MLPQQHSEPRCLPKWDDHHTQAAISAARRQAARWARCGRRSRADREDLSQDILLAIVERAPHFDPGQGSWDAFVGLLARHVVSDRLRADGRPAQVTMVALDVEEFDAAMPLASVTQVEAADDVDAIARRLDLEAALGDLPPLPREILALLLIHHGDVAAARRASGRSCSAFYRAVDELRLWLRAAGLGVSTEPRGKNRDLDR